MLQIYEREENNLISLEIFIRLNWFDSFLQVSKKKLTKPLSAT